MKSERLILIALLVLAVGFIGKIALDTKVASDRVSHLAQKHEALHRANEARRKRLAYAAHLRRAAYDAAHPQEVAQRKAAAAEARKLAEAAKAATRAKQREAARIAMIASHERQARENREKHPCQTADSLEREAAADINSGRMQATYDTVIAALHYNDLCDDATDRIVNAGYLLSFKAYAEHSLGRGDWRTDYNQANALLVQCQTIPGLYGTHAGAQCETQEHNNISNETHWDIYQ
jgi:Tfp pilus assembly protein PilV